MVDWEDFYSSFRRTDFIPGYEILNHLGGGAFGEVYKAKKRSIGKHYAIKFLRLDDESQRDGVERELDSVRLFAAIDHPNLVTIEDMGVVSGVPYLIMGYAGGDTLARHLRDADLTPDRAMRYFVQACRGVLALHDRRLAHFDLKPSNIFIRGDVARVGDYGLAKLLVEGRQTLSFGRGTPQYMAPEMLRNRADHRADLYSLGVILFESLALRLPFEAGSSGMIVRENDVPPEFPADFPQHLRPIVTRLLRIDPDERYASVQELLELLGQASRQGDSVRIRHGDLPTETRALQEESGRAVAPVEGEPPDSASPGSASRGAQATQPDSKGKELKQAAAELARGAVGVAKGVWEGVRERISTPPKAEQGRAQEPVGGTADRSAAAAGGGKPDKERTAEFERSAQRKARDIVDVVKKTAGERLTDAPELDAHAASTDSPPAAAPPAGRSGTVGGDVVSVSTLDDEDDPTPEELEAAALSPPDAPWRRELERTREERREAYEPVLLSRSAEPVLAVQTIPVPPRAEGGLVGNVLQSAIVGAEIMGTLVTGPFLVALRGTAALFDRVLSGVPGLVGTLLRTLMMLLLMALLGGLAAFAFLAALQMRAPL